MELAGPGQALPVKAGGRAAPIQFTGKVSSPGFETAGRPPGRHHIPQVARAPLDAQLGAVTVTVMAPIEGTVQVDAGHLPA